MVQEDSSSKLNWATHAAFPFMVSFVSTDWQKSFSNDPFKNIFAVHFKLSVNLLCHLFASPFIKWIFCDTTPPEFVLRFILISTIGEPSEDEYLRYVSTVPSGMVEIFISPLPCRLLVGRISSFPPSVWKSTVPSKAKTSVSCLNMILVRLSKHSR